MEQIASVQWAERYQSFAFFRGKVYFPTIGLMPNGLPSEMDPVQVLPATVSALVDALAQARVAPKPLAKGYVPGDPRPKSPLQRAARCRSWVAFARESVRCALVSVDNKWQIAVSAGPRSDEAVVQELPGDTSPRDLAMAVLDIAERYHEWRPEGLER